jgi:hypothetical protein
LDFDFLLNDLTSGNEDKRIHSAETIFNLAKENDPIFDTNNILKLAMKMGDISQRLEPDIIYFIDTFTILYKKGMISNDIIDRWIDGQNSNCLEILIIILPFFEEKKQQEVASILFNIICKVNENNVLYIKFIKSLKECNLEWVLHLAVKNLGYTDTKILLSIDVLTIYGNKSHSKPLLNILEKIVVRGYQYAGTLDVIQRKILNFYLTNIDESLINPLILFLNFKLRMDVWESLSDVFVAVEDKSVLPIIQYIYENSNKYDSVNILLNALSKMHSNVLRYLDINKLFTICYTLQRNFPRDDYLILILTKNEKDSKSIIKKLLEGSDRDYEFVRKVISSRGETIRDYINSNIIININNIIINELHHDRKKDMRKLEKLIIEEFKEDKKEITFSMTKFEYLMTNLLVASGFITQFIDIGVQGIDIIALSPSIDILLMIGCTTANVVGDDSKLLTAKVKLSRHNLPIEIVPIIAISLQKYEISGYDEIKNKGINIITKDDISILYDMIISNRQHKEILSYILDRNII